MKFEDTKLPDHPEIRKVFDHWDHMVSRGDPVYRKEADRDIFLPGFAAARVLAEHKSTEKNHNMIAATLLVSLFQHIEWDAWRDSSQTIAKIAGFIPEAKTVQYMQDYIKAVADTPPASLSTPEAELVKMSLAYAVAQQIAPTRDRQLGFVENFNEIYTPVKAAVEKSFDEIDAMSQKKPPQPPKKGPTP